MVINKSHKHTGVAASKNSRAGFTLIELMVVTGILIVVSTLMFTSNSRFGGVILLENLAYDTALSLRKAQVFGIAVRRFGSGDFEAGYGINFDFNTPTTYTLFADAYPSSSGDGIFQLDQGEAVESFTMQAGYRVVDLCATPSGGASETCGLGTLDILFQRPEPDAYISANGNSGVVNPALLNERGRIVIESPRGDRISVIVEVTGQIAVQKI